MKLGHLHINFRDLEASVEWMKKVMNKLPDYQNQGMAVFGFDHTSLIFDKGEEDTGITIAFDSNDCDADYTALVKRGALGVERPSNQPWGVRVAYLQGPGKTTIEIEQALK